MTSHSKKPRSAAALAALFFFALAAVLHYASELIIPVVLAGLLTVLLSPVVERLSRWGLPQVLSSAIALLLLVTAIFGAMLLLAEPAEQWIDQAPRSLRDLKLLLESGGGHLHNITAIAEQVDELSTVQVPADAQPVIVKGPGALETVIGGLPSFLFSLAIVVILTFFALGSEYGWRKRLMMFGDSLAERRHILRMSGQIRSQLSRYLLTVTIINVVLGVVTALLLSALDFPNPMLWGLMVAVFNFAPYVGSIASAGVLLIVSAASFDSLSQALIAPGCFLALTFIEGQLVTPAILGRRFSISPIVVFLSVIAWGWLWGVAGALMAVPLMMAIKVCADNLPSLQWLSAALDSSPTPRQHRSPAPRGVSTRRQRALVHNAPRR